MKTILGRIVLVVACGLPAGAVADTKDDAQRFLLRGQEAVAIAKTSADFQAAVKEISEAVRIAPDFADAWYNLGLVQEKAGDLPSAMKSMRRYLELAPNAPDAQSVRDTLVRWEYRAERAQQRPEGIRRPRAN